MSAAPVATNLHKALNIKVNFFPEITLNPVFPSNILSETIKLFFSKIICLGNRIDTSLAQNPLAQARTNAINIL
jgi:hypothetical protein